MARRTTSPVSPRARPGPARLVDEALLRLRCRGRGGDQRTPRAGPAGSCSSQTVSCQMVLCFFFPPEAGGCWEGRRRDTWSELGLLLAGSAFLEQRRRGAWGPRERFLGESLALSCLQATRSSLFFGSSLFAFCISEVNPSGVNPSLARCPPGFQASIPGIPSGPWDRPEVISEHWVVA